MNSPFLQVPKYYIYVLFHRQQFPKLIKDLLDWVNTRKKRKGVYIAEVALLFEKKLQNKFDGVILVNVNRGVLIERIVKKYKFSIR